MQQNSETLRARVQGLRPELDHAINEQVTSFLLDGGNDLVEWDAGRYAAVVQAIDFALSAIDHEDHGSQPIPPAVSTPARRAARLGVPVDRVLSLYSAGQSMLHEAILGSIVSDGTIDRQAGVSLVLSLQNAFNRITAEVAGAHEREVTNTVRSPDRLLTDRVQQLLSGASFLTSGLEYRFHGTWHSCAIVQGGATEPVVRELARVLKRDLLAVPRCSHLVWAWFGGRHPLEAGELEAAARLRVADDLEIALGEPGQGLNGWRVTHRQAQAAFRVALAEPKLCTKWADVAFVSPWLRDSALAHSFVDLMLSSLNHLRDGGANARVTLRAYFQVGCQNEAAALQLGIDRSSFAKRLRKIEGRLGYPPATRRGELETALMLETLLKAAAFAATYTPRTR